MLYTCKYQFENISLYLVATETHLINIQFTQPQKALLQTTELLSMATIQLDEYFQGKRTTFSLPFKLTGTPFQLAVWKELQNIPYGKTTSYKEITQKINKPKAYRAVGMANNKNPLPIIIPCHRVIGSDGRLTGYAGGTARKLALLQLEGVDCKEQYQPRRDGDCK